MRGTGGTRVQGRARGQRFSQRFLGFAAIGAMLPVSRSRAAGEPQAIDGEGLQEMNRAVIRASALSGIAAACAMAGIAHAELTIQLGTVQQVSPRPSIVYTGNYGAFVTSHLDAAGIRTVTSFDIHGIAQQLGGNLALVAVRVRDTGANSYGNWSPGADIDLFRVVGTDLTRGTVSAGYQGAVAQHTGETDSTLKTRIADCDAVSGDQHFNSQHFISLGLNGLAWLNFSDFAQNQGGLAGDGPGDWGGGSGGGDGPGEQGGGGGGGGGETTYGGIIVHSGMRLEIGEAGLGESYAAELVFEQIAVPAPGALALLAGAGLLRRRRR